jgi:hypothetical protein
LRDFFTWKQKSWPYRSAVKILVSFLWCDIPNSHLFAFVKIFHDDLDQTLFTCNVIHFSFSQTRTIKF